MIEVDIYAVGWLWAWKTRGMKSEWRAHIYWAKRGNWRAIRNSFNGYLAEHVDCHHDAGRGGGLRTEPHAEPARSA